MVGLIETTVDRVELERRSPIAGSDQAWMGEGRERGRGRGRGREGKGGEAEAEAEGKGPSLGEPCIKPR